MFFNGKEQLPLPKNSLEDLALDVVHIVLPNTLATPADMRGINKFQ